MTVEPLKTYKLLILVKLDKTSCPLATKAVLAAFFFLKLIQINFQVNMKKAVYSSKLWGRIIDFDHCMIKRLTVLNFLTVWNSLSNN